MTVVIGHKEAA